MKYLVLLCDGMADQKLEQLGNKTPMMAAKKPVMDNLAKKSVVGMVKTVADGLKPGSDVANLSVMGYDPKKFYSGRSPLEAASIGIEMSTSDIAIRCNLVTLSDEPNFEDKHMVDYCADDIKTSDADVIIKDLAKEFNTKDMQFFTGVSYRHCLVLRNKENNLGELVPPHDISGKCVGEY
ncbi:MAG: phosphoglycerate mutase, partial [Oscillospiraceae bacterium]